MILAGDHTPELYETALNLGPGTVLCVLDGPILSAQHGLKPALKSGPSLYSISLPERLPGSEGETHFALASNHFMDFGTAGMEKSFEQLSMAGSKFSGAGKNVGEARRPMVFESDGVRVGVISCCEAQYGVAGAAAPGVAEIGPWIYPALAKLRGEIDVAVVSVHASVEMSPWPSPYLQELYRSWIDAGALIVHGHHAHQPQGIEHYGGGIISYGSANLLVCPERWAEGVDTYWSLAVDVDLNSRPLRGRVFSTEIRRQNRMLVAEPSNAAEAKSHEDYIAAVTAPLLDPSLLEALWQETAVRSLIRLYADPLRAPTGIQRRFNLKQRVKALRAGFLEAAGAVIGREVSTDFVKRSCMNWHHYFACISHRDAIATGLGVLSGAVSDLRTEASSSLADKFMTFFPKVDRKKQGMT
ncbi:CapA family protein [Prosthecobacter sp.]|uniref:CapA family protein n=1 Tax=Prosthecobacter sp. TaxID=1965333 RepID=UPI002AB8F91C|nr:CapA family protein [Prosthecobacter sp.]MDZ4401082.1 CapA family protein [Prosthecobacter sp.]